MEKILVLDDDQDSLDFIKQILTDDNEQKYKLITTQKTLEALDLIQALKFDLILTDIRMTNWSGFDFVESLKKNKRFKDIPIIMISGLKEKKDVEKAIKVGASDYILKPFDPLVVREKVKNIIKKHKKNQSNLLQVNFNKKTSSIRGEISIEVEIIKVYEDGLDFTATHAFKEGEIIKINCPIFLKMKLQNFIPLRVLGSSFIEDIHQWEISCCFYGLQESSIQKIRSWIYSKQTEKNKRIPV